ncbi:hypothetical protein AF69_05950 [Streptococcus uberis 6736]|nr:hypothetical protein AF69_05950 [Streptococcus uberis 6736]
MIYDLVLKTHRLIKIFLCKHQYEYIVVKGLLGPIDHYYKCAKCGRTREEMP